VLLKVYVEYEGSLSYESSYGRTPIDIAQYRGCKDSLNYLLKFDPEITR